MGHKSSTFGIQALRHNHLVAHLSISIYLCIYPANQTARIVIVIHLDRLNRVTPSWFIPINKKLEIGANISGLYYGYINPLEPGIHFV